jgi:hypothetical protein
MVQVPTKLAEIDAGWLTEALRHAGHDAPSVTSLTYEPMPGIVGLLGEVGIFNATFEGATDVPSRLLGKCPLGTDAARLYNAVMRYYERETGFYRDLAGQVPMRVPDCWVNLSEGEHHVLLLEYFDEATPGDVLLGTDFDSFKFLIGGMARMHARYWMDRDVHDLPWMFRFTDPMLLMGFDVVRDSWPQVMAQEPDLVPADLRALIEGPYLSEYTPQQWVDTYAARPWTLVHGDLQLENVLFLDGREPAIVDWQGVMVGFPGMDLGYTLAISGTAETVDRERELLDHYRAELKAAGGPDWSHDELVDDLAWAMLFFVAGNTAPLVQDYSAMGAHADRLLRRMKAAMQGCVDAAVRWETAARISAPA